MRRDGTAVLIDADHIQALEIEYARFNERRTLGSSVVNEFVSTAVGRVMLLGTPANRIVGLGPDSIAGLDELLGEFAAPPRIDVRDEDCTPQVQAELEQRGYARTGGLCFLALEAPWPIESVQHEIRRWTAIESDAFLDLLEVAGDSTIPAETRAAKRGFYCSDRFRTFVAEVDNHPIAWATMYVADDARHGYLANAYTHPDYRGRGVQHDLIRARLQDGAELGLATLVVDVEPDTTSLRNCSRAGFELVSVHEIWTTKEAALPSPDRAADN